MAEQDLDSTPPRTLAELRARIDVVDDSIMTALVERLALTEEVARAKRLDGQEIFDPEREEQILGRARSLPRGLPVARAMTHIISVCRREMYAMTENLDDSL